MTEWILKLVTAINSVKTALKLFFLGVLLVFCWSFMNEAMVSKGLPAELIPYIIVLCAYSTSHLITEGLYRVKSWNDNIRKANQEAEKKKQEKEQKQREKEAKTEALRSEFEATIPHLDSFELSFLMKLLQKNTVKDRRNHPAYHFHQRKFIKIVGKKSNYECVYELDPTVRECVTLYFAEARKKAIVSFSKNLDEHNVHFLRIFFDKEIPFGVSKQEEKMEHRVYQSHYKMIPESLIMCDGYTFTLPDDTRDQLIHDGHFNSCFRSEVKLDPAYILGVNSSGGFRGAVRI